MRKHFLILMLLSLLPLAGWAAIDISGYRITVATDNYVYTGNAVAIEPQVKNENLTNPTPLNYNVNGVDDDYQLVFYKDGVELLGAPSAVGSYVVKARGIGNYSGETTTGAGFIIRKAELTIEIGTLGNANADPVVPPTFKKNYKAADPEMPAIGTWIFKVEGQGIGNNVGQGLLNVTTTPYYEYSGENANEDGYDITFKGFSLKSEYEGNYELTVVARKMIIDPIAITTGDNATVDVTPDAVPAHEYDGTAYKPTFTLEYAYGDGANDVYTLNSNNASDYVLKYYPYANNTLGAAVTDPINAGTYHAYVTAGTSGNFTAAGETGVKVGEFEITQKALTIAVNPKTKDYDGEAFDEDDAEFTISGLASTDEGMIEGLAAEVHDNGVLSANAGSWTMDVVSNAATIGTGTNAPLLSSNYEVTPLSSTWKINKIALTVKATDETAVLGAAVPQSEVVVSGAINAEQEVAIANAFQITPAQDLNTDDYGVTEDAYVISLIPATAYEDYENEASESYNNAQAVLGNYVALVANETLLNGSLTVTGGNFIVMPVISNKIPYGTTPVPEVLAYTTGDNPTQLVENTDYEKVGNAYGFKVKLATDADEAANWKSIDQFTFAVNTTYNIKVDAATVKGKGNYVKAANAQEDNFTCASATFTIKPKKVYYQISDVTLHVGDTEANLNEGTTKATATLKTGEGYENNTLVGDETLEFTFKFEENIDGLEIDDDGKISEDDDPGLGEDNGAITAEVKATATYKDNYDVVFFNGNLSFAEFELILDPEDEDMAAKISEAKTNGNKFAITFKSRTTGENATSTFAKSTMKANEWYAKVLPFDITTVELVKALNAYVVVNVLSEASTDKNYKFKIEMSNIPAGTPFLIKPEKDINWSVFDLVETRKITADAVKPVTVQQEGKDVVTFTGTFAPMTMHYNDTDADIAERVWWLSDTDYQATKIANDWRKPKNNLHKLGAMEAYLVAGEGWTTYAPTFTVEDFDFENNTTAIKVLNTQTMKAYDAEGWYNLNGVKLQGAPTEKGIYINNGKKVIVK